MGAPEICDSGAPRPSRTPGGYAAPSQMQPRRRGCLFSRASAREGRCDDVRRGRRGGRRPEARTKLGHHDDGEANDAEPEMRLVGHAFGERGDFARVKHTPCPSEPVRTNATIGRCPYGAGVAFSTRRRRSDTPRPRLDARFTAPSAETSSAPRRTWRPQTRPARRRRAAPRRREAAEWTRA